MTTHLATSAESDVVEVVLKALQRAEAPLSASQLHKQLTGPFKRPVRQLGQLLETMATEGRIHRFPPSRGKAHRYWTQDQNQYIRQAMIFALSNGPLNETKLFQQLKDVKKGVAKERLQQIRRDLVNEGQIVEWPPVGRSKTSRFGRTPPHPQEYLESAVKKFEKDVRDVARKLNGAGLSFDQVVRSALEELRSRLRPTEPPPQPLDLAELSRLVVDRMLEIAPAAANGALVSLRDLWRSLEFQMADKVAFDATVLWMADQGIVALHRHDYPASLTEAERAEMIPDERGSYYIGVALRV